MAPSEATPLLPVEGNRTRHKRLMGLAAFLVVFAVTLVWFTETVGGGDGTSGVTAKGDFRCRDADNEAGYVKLPGKEDDYYFYWFFESRRDPKVDPLVLWLSGGPGCSSLTTLLNENGPCSVNEDLTTKRNPFSWNSEANVIWLDQPTDVGFSYGETDDYDHSEDDVQVNIYSFLLGFLDKHPEFHDRPFFITGESYAGHYIPAAAHYIWLQNRDETATKRINLQGIAIGNGLVNPVVQSKHALDMISNAYNVTLMDASHLAKAKAELPKCIALVEDCQTNTTTCLDAALFCQTELQSWYAASHRNKCDIRQFCDEDDPVNCYNVSTIERYLNSARVRSYLSINVSHNKTWESCSAAVGMGFAFDMTKRFDHYIADLLNDGAVRVLAYYGDADLMCNWYGGLAWMQELKWKHQREFNDAQDHPFMAHGVSDEAGLARAYKNQLTFIRVFHAGHFAPMDQPAVALDMINRFLRGDEL